MNEYQYFCSFIRFCQEWRIPVRRIIFIYDPINYDKWIEIKRGGKVITKELVDRFWKVIYKYKETVEKGQAVVWKERIETAHMKAVKDGKAIKVCDGGRRLWVNSKDLSLLRGKKRPARRKASGMANGSGQRSGRGFPYGKFNAKGDA